MALVVENPEMRQIKEFLLTNKWEKLLRLAEGKEFHIFLELDLLCHEIPDSQQLCQNIVLHPKKYANLIADAIRELIDHVLPATTRGKDSVDAYLDQQLVKAREYFNTLKGKAVKPRSLALPDACPQNAALFPFHQPILPPEVVGRRLQVIFMARSAVNSVSVRAVVAKDSERLVGVRGKVTYVSGINELYELQTFVCCTCGAFIFKMCDSSKPIGYDHPTLPKCPREHCVTRRPYNQYTKLDATVQFGEHRKLFIEDLETDVPEKLISKSLLVHCNGEVSKTEVKINDTVIITGILISSGENAGSDVSVMKYDVFGKVTNQILEAHDVNVNPVIEPRDAVVQFSSQESGDMPDEDDALFLSIEEPVYARPRRLEAPPARRAEATAAAPPAPLESVTPNIPVAPAAASAPGSSQGNVPHGTGDLAWLNDEDADYDMQITLYEQIQQQHQLLQSFNQPSQFLQEQPQAQIPQQPLSQQQREHVFKKPRDPLPLQQVQKPKQPSPQQGKIVLATSGLKSENFKVILEFCTLFQGLIFGNVVHEVTHLIVPVTPNENIQVSFKYLLAIAKKLWIVGLPWVIKCVESKTLVPEDDYETGGFPYCHPGGKISRLTTDDLFHGYEFSFDPNLDTEIEIGYSYDEMKELLIALGGRVYTSIENMRDSREFQSRTLVVVVENDTDVDYCSEWIMDGLLPVTPAWIVQSVLYYEPQPYKNSL